MPVRLVPALSSADRRAVRELAVRATAHDAVAALSEETLLRISAATPGAGQHLLVERDGHLLGYAHLDDSDPAAPWAELVVEVSQRRTGVGTELLTRILQLAPATRLWAHGYLPSAQAFAQRHGLAVVRELWQMARRLADLPASRTVPAGFVVSTLCPGDERDEGDWLATNAAAFASHPEQGRMTLADLRARQRETWFDPAGFFLVRDDRPGPERGRLAAFHWTKVEPSSCPPTPTGEATPRAGSPEAESAAAGEPAGEPDGTTGAARQGSGEVYVVGVHPDYQGLGLGAAVTGLGLEHLRQLGLAEVRLYVDGDNTAAIATYRRYGFEQDALDVQLARTPSDPAEVDEGTPGSQTDPGSDSAPARPGDDTIGK